MTKLEPCPVCGRIPKIRTYDVNIAWVECKPWYRRKAHKATDVLCALPSTQPSELFEEVIAEWNALVDCANLPVW